MTKPHDIQMEDISNAFWIRSHVLRTWGILLHNKSPLTIGWRREKLIMHFMIMLCMWKVMWETLLLRILNAEGDLRVGVAKGGSECSASWVVRDFVRRGGVPTNNGQVGYNKAHRNGCNLSRAMLGGESSNWISSNGLIPLYVLVRGLHTDSIWKGFLKSHVYNSKFKLCANLC